MQLNYRNLISRAFAAAIVCVAFTFTALTFNKAARAEENSKADAAAKPAALPAEVDLRPTFNALNLPPRPQGRRGTCSVFTTAGAFEFALAKQRGAGEPLSVEYLNWATNQVIHNDRDRGQFFHDLLHGYEQYGICFESEMPYKRRFRTSVVPDEKARESAQHVKDNKFEVHWIKPIDQKNPGLTEEQMTTVKQVIASGYPVAAGAAHSRLLVGYVDKSEEPGGGIFYTKDSGSGSFSQVTYEFVQKQVNDAFWINLTEAAPAAKPATEPNATAAPATKDAPAEPAKTQ